MCGIVGYVGPRSAAPVLLDGLARLEYRGYDSAGIALVTGDGELFIQKKAGKVAEPRPAVAAEAPEAGVGPGHTPLPTPGPPNEPNAPPQIALPR